MDTSNVLLTMRQINKHFPGVQALKEVDFTLYSGEVHALMGENGAGKSTLIKVLTGAESFESGEIRLKNYPYPLINRTPQEAQNRGISTVYQEVNLCPNLSVTENLFIGRETMKMGLIQWQVMHEKARHMLADLDMAIDVTLTLDNYSVAIQQMVAIARAIDIKAQVLILDEPTSSLDDHEVKKLFQVMNMLKERGIGIIFVTHFLEQVYAISDRITVLRNGEWIGSYETESLSRIDLVHAMMGQAMEAFENQKETMDRSQEPAFIEVQDLTRKGAIEPFDLSIKKGEIIGLSGLLGSGRSELARLLFGADLADSGRIAVKGVLRWLKGPKDAIALGIGFLPENRKEDGILADLSVRENIILALQAKRSVFKLYSKKEQTDFAERYIKALRIKTASIDTPVKQLSGGNQQKVILARWLLTDPELLIVDEPTRGIDVGTKAEIQKLMIKLAKTDKAILFISSEIEEMLHTCTRLVVLRDRAVIGELTTEEMTQANIMKVIAGGQ